MAYRHIIEIQQFSKKGLQEILNAADDIKDRIDRHLPLDFLKGRILGNLFYVKSIGTSLSFDVAMKRLGGSVSNIDFSKGFSTEVTEWSFEDTVRVVGCLVDVIVLAYYRSGSAKRASEISAVPIINGGDWPSQHPTQALIDLYFIKKLKGGIDGISIAFIGELMNSRTARSLAYLLAKYSGIRMFFVSPRTLMMKEDLKEYLTNNQVPFSESLDSGKELKEIASEVDILYITQTPKSNFGSRISDYDQSRDIFQINQEVLKVMKRNTYIMHPFPRDCELPAEIDQDPRAVYFEQMKYGQYLRMALLCLVLGVPLA